MFVSRRISPRLRDICPALSLAELENRMPDLATHKQPIIVVCKTDRRSARAATQLQAAGLRNVAVLRGGTDGWYQRDTLLNDACMQWMYAALWNIFGGLTAPIIAYFAANWGLGFAMPMAIGTFGGTISFIIAMSLGPETRGKHLTPELGVAVT